MKIAIVDDESLYTEEIKSLCHTFSAHSNVSMQTACFSSGSDFLETFQAGEYQLVFLDIYMEGMNGVETARRLREMDHACFLVFLTSTSEFMPEAFSFHAFDYIVKPIPEQKVFQLLSDVQKHLPELPPCIEVSSGRKSISLLLSDILSVVNDAHYLDIRTRDGKSHRCRMTSESFLRLTGNDPRFLSANRGILVNADYVETIDKESCVMTDGTIFPIRIRDNSRLENALRQYHFSRLRSGQRRRQTC